MNCIILLLLLGCCGGWGNDCCGCATCGDNGCRGRMTERRDCGRREPCGRDCDRDCGRGEPCGRDCDRDCGRGEPCGRDCDRDCDRRQNDCGCEDRMTAAVKTAPAQAGTAAARRTKGRAAMCPA